MYETHKYTSCGQNSGYFNVTVSVHKVPKNKKIEMYQYLIQTSQAITSTSGLSLWSKKITLWHYTEISMHTNTCTI